MSNDSIGHFFGTTGTSQHDDIANLWVLAFDEAASTTAGSTEWNAEGYFGNEASDIDFYVKAALIMDVPKYSESRGVVVESSKKRKAK